MNKFKSRDAHLSLPKFFIYSQTVRLKMIKYSLCDTKIYNCIRSVIIKDRKTQRDTERETERDRQRERDTHTARDRDRKRERQAH